MRAEGLYFDHAIDSVLKAVAKRPCREGGSDAVGVSMSGGTVAPLAIWRPERAPERPSQPYEAIWGLSACQG